MPRNAAPPHSSNTAFAVAEDTMTRRQREEIQRRVSEERKRHGGSMFAGSAGYVEGEPDETGAEDDVWHDPDEMTLF